MNLYGKFEENYGIVGRWFTTQIEGIDYLATINMGAQLYFRVTGTEMLRLHFRVQEHPSTIVYQIDDGKPQWCLVGERVDVATALDPNRSYEIKLMVEGIPECNDLWNQHSGILFEGAEVSAAGQIEKIMPTGKQILFIGDSITAGIAVRPDHRGHPYTAAASINYAGLCSQMLGAIDLRCAFGYTGIVNPGPIGIPACQGYLEEICHGVKAPELTPDVVVINHGTNDALHEQPVEAFEKGYQSLLKDVRVRYPQAKILVLIPFGQYLADEIRRVVVADGHSHLVETKDWGVTFTDGVHVDIKGNQIAAAKLAEVIEKI